jgi:hypothetical protein
MNLHDTHGTWVRPDLVDQLLELYCDWRTECSGVRAAYEHFSEAAASERELAFAAYGAALDREASAADRYETQVDLVASLAAGYHPPARPQIVRRR